MKKTFTEKLKWKLMTTLTWEETHYIIQGLDCLKDFDKATDKKIKSLKDKLAFGQVVVK